MILVKRVKKEKLLIYQTFNNAMDLSKFIVDNKIKRKQIQQICTNYNEPRYEQITVPDCISGVKVTLFYWVTTYKDKK